MKIRPWQPDKGNVSGPQRRFLHDFADVYEVLNAGSVGSGKTDAGVMACVYYREYRAAPSFCGLVLRHDEKDLRKHILNLVDRPGYFRRYGGGQLNSTDMVWRLSRGGQIVFAHAKRLSALHGPEFAYVWWDELTHWKGTGWMDSDPPPEYLFVNFTRVRSAAGLRCRVRGGSNILGPGRPWIRRRWGPWLSGKYLTVAEAAPPHHRAAVESYRRLIEQGHAPEPGAGPPLPSGHVLWFHPHADGTETWEPPPRDEDDAQRRELLSRSCLVTQTSDNPALAEGDPQYALRTRAAGVGLHAQLSGQDWDYEEPGEGFFRRTWFPVVQREAVPQLAGVLARWDFAWSRHERGGKAAERSPWSVRVLLGWTHKHPILGRSWYLLHVVRAQGDPNEIMKLVRQTAELDGMHVPVVVPCDFSAGKVVVSTVRNLLEGWRVIEQQERGEKDVRISALQNPAEARQIILVGGECNHAFLDEAARYPRRPVDQLDALAGAYLHVIETEGGLPSDEQIDAALGHLAPVTQALGTSSGGSSRSSRSAADIFRAQYEREEIDPLGSDGWGPG